MKLNWKSCFRAAATLFALYVAIQVWPKVTGVLLTVLSAALPLLIGAVIAYVLGIPMAFYEKTLFGKCRSKWAKALRRPVCLTLAFLTAAAIVALVVVLILPQLVDCVQLLGEVPFVLEKGVELIGRLELLPEDIYAWLQDVDWKNGLMKIGKALVSGVSGLMGTVMQTVGSVFSGIVTGVLSVIFAIYLLAGKEDLQRQGGKLLKRYVKAERNREKLLLILRTLEDSFHKFIVGQCVEALILGVMCLIGMWCLKLPYAPMISALIAFTALIPVAGAYIGAGIGAFMILMVSPMQALIFLIFLIVLQQLEGNLIYPRVVGTSIGLPALWVLAAVTVGGGVMGVAGMLIGVPLAAAGYRLLRMQLEEKTEANDTVQTEV